MTKSNINKLLCMFNFLAAIFIIRVISQQQFSEAGGLFTIPKGILIIIIIALSINATLYKANELFSERDKRILIGLGIAISLLGGILPILIGAILYLIFRKAYSSSFYINPQIGFMFLNMLVLICGIHYIIVT